MDIRPARVLSLCTGTGGLDLGFKMAMPDSRMVCYVERDAFPILHLVQKMEAGFMDEAPLWSDISTFDGRPWRGAVDCIVAGFPCQPHSVAGLRQGADDERDLWPQVARIIGEVQPGICFLENVAGVLRYYHDAIGPELRRLGYRTAEGLFSAEEIGAPHQRQRLFIVACADDQGAPEHRQPRPERGIQEHRGSRDGALENAASEGRRNGAIRPSAKAPEREHGQPERPSIELVHAGSIGQREEGAGGNLPPGVPVGLHGETMADAGQQGLQGFRRAGEENTLPRLEYLFPPRPNDLDTWAYLLSEMPEIEPAICRIADGLDDELDPTSEVAQRLRIIGNGVVPLVAAYAFRTLMARISGPTAYGE